MRTRYRKDGLVPDRIRLLESINGWVQDQITADFQNGLQQLKKYVEKYGNAKVVDIYTDYSGFKLGSWVLTQRVKYKKGKLIQSRIVQLEAVQSWVWDKFE